MRPDDNAIAPNAFGQNNGQNNGYEEADHMADNTDITNTDITNTTNTTDTADTTDTISNGDTTDTTDIASNGDSEAMGASGAEAGHAETEHAAETANDHVVPAVDPEDYTAQDDHVSQANHDDDMDGADMSEMARLLDEQDVQFKSIKRGDVVEGQIVHMDDDEILVDIGLKSEGVLSMKELPATGYGSREELHVGDNVLVYVVQPETPEGHAIVSIKRARLERQWRIAQEQYERGELLEAEVIDFNKGGLIVNLDGIRGFVPISQILNLKREDNADNAETQQKLQSMVGRKLQLKIIEINRNRNRLILSERLAVQEWRARRREELLNELEVGEVRTGTVSNLANFGAFVDLGGADGLVHISQLAWSRVNHPSEVLKVGQKVEVQVLSVDKEKKKIALSIKRAEVDPWTTVEQRYAVGQTVTGTITKIAPFGAFARIEDGVEGLIHLSELPSGVSDPKQVLREGEEVTVRILRIDPERRRLGLSMRQADEEGAAETTTPESSAEATAPTAGVAAGVAAGETPATSGAGGAAAPAEETATTARQRQQPPRAEEPPTTAMAAAFAAARRDQAPEAPVADEAPPATAPTAETPTEAPETTAPAPETPAPEAVTEAAPEATAETLSPETPTPETPADEVPPDATQVEAAETAAAQTAAAEAAPVEQAASEGASTADTPTEGASDVATDVTAEAPSEATVEATAETTPATAAETEDASES